MEGRLDPGQARRKAARRLELRWADHLAGSDPDAWPHAILLDSGSAHNREGDIGGMLDWAERWWREPLPADGVLGVTGRRVHGTRQELPSRLVLSTIDAAAEFAAGSWRSRLAVARSRLAALRNPAGGPVTGGSLRAATELTEVDFDVLRAALAWFADHREDGMTARQVPVPGLHSKWIEAHRPLLAGLLGRDLRLAPRPARVDITYLDSRHLGAGGRRWDSLAVSGDPAAVPAYRPELVVVCENKDTAAYFPQVPGGIAVHGSGAAAAALLPQLPWVRDCSRVLYWGDMDAAGYAILDGLRAAGLSVGSLLMDDRAYDRYRHLGVDRHPDGRPIKVDERKMPHLTEPETAAYRMVNGSGPRRIEQERIPLEDARRSIAELVAEDRERD